MIIKKFFEYNITDYRPVDVDPLTGAQVTMFVFNNDVTDLGDIAGTIIKDDLELSMRGITRGKLKTLGNLQHVGGYIALEETPLESLGNLKTVGGDLLVQYCESLKSLGYLESVGEYLDATDCKSLKSLGNLISVGSSLDLTGCELLKSLGNLKSVGKSLDLGETLVEEMEDLKNLEFVGDWINLGNTPLRKKYSKIEIHEMFRANNIKIGNRFYL